jgi:hypothetical protein
MRLIPRRKRTWQLVLVVVAIAGAATMWQAVTAKSDFERNFDLAETGMTSQEVAKVIGKENVAIAPAFLAGAGDSVLGIGLIDGGERADFEFRGNRLTKKTFTTLPIVERLRRLWVRKLGSKPPF